MAMAANTDIIGGVESPQEILDCVIGTFNVLEAMKIKHQKYSFLIDRCSLWGFMFRNSNLKSGASSTSINLQQVK